MAFQDGWGLRSLEWAWLSAEEARWPRTMAQALRVQPPRVASSVASGITAFAPMGGGKFSNV
eukprot:9093944-Pyramimonas_sp.AAC.1